jgi:hypothetical protein
LWEGSGIRFHTPVEILVTPSDYLDGFGNKAVFTKFSGFREKPASF